MWDTSCVIRNGRRMCISSDVQFVVDISRPLCAFVPIWRASSFSCRKVARGMVSWVLTTPPESQANYIICLLLPLPRFQPRGSPASPPSSLRRPCRSLFRYRVGRRRCYVRPVKEKKKKPEHDLRRSRELADGLIFIEKYQNGSIPAALRELRKK